ncbi:hypothetical protein AVEN_99527-1 [Araneus ventricosus]|uniref:Integrase catalytic domain-containing protein n=1 Tax=Araneus ventricosus TaxID=182803 RepID=A0A4Y2LJR7_ARAVE|nr:hypothetical protein AVEN_99527-1 [Araneus ventricosus]
MSQLTKEFEDRLGASPRFSTPSYPASNGLVEKWYRVFKQMLHHEILASFMKPVMIEIRSWILYIRHIRATRGRRFPEGFVTVWLKLTCKKTYGAKLPD